MMKSVVAACVAAAAVHAAAGEREEAALRAALPGVFERAAAHYRALDAAAARLMKGEDGELRYPHGYSPVKREIRMCPVKGWTAGHFPGSLWYVYEATGDEFFRDRALAWTEIVAPNSKVTTNHDVGFIMYCSFGNARRLLKTDRYDALLAETAESLSTRFSDVLGLIRSWGKRDETKDFLVIPDNMMNLELLEEVSKITGDGRYAKIARSHADVTMRHHFRADGGCYHVLNYDQRPGFAGRVQEIRRGQGASCETAWARGQSWAIYGYTMMFRETGDGRYLAFAQKLADFAVDNPNMPEDGVPCWDYGAPGEERDSSAGAIMASALLELSGFVPGAKGAAYRAFAVKQLASLASPAYFSEGDEAGHFLLKHGVGHKPGNSEVDVSLNYGDYYFLEALLRFRALPAGCAAAKPRVDARHIPERMDDFLFENAFAAFRAYGPKLAMPKPEGQGFSSNGIDVFNKGVADVCGAETVLAGVKSRVSYHADNGRCFDSYTVGPGAGCGGLRRRAADGAWRADGNWKSQRVVELTPCRAVFELEYESCTLRGTVVADSPFVRFDVAPKAAAAEGAEWGPGLDVSAARGHGGSQLVDLGRLVLANAEDESGTYTAVVLEPSAGAARLAADASGSLCLLVPEGPFTYYVAAAWRGMGTFPTAESWFARVRAFADSLRSPVVELEPPIVEGIAGFIEPDAKRNLRMNPEWRGRLRFVKSSLDGSRQPFYWYDPGVAGRVPLVVAFHSWGASCNWSTPATGVQRYCAANGWAMAYPNFRGPNRRPEACGSDLAVQDVLDVVEWAKREREIDADRVYMIGGSGGGHFTLLMSGRHPEVFAGAAAFCPISDLARWYGESKARGTGYDKAIAASCGGTPDEAAAEYAKRSPLTYLANARSAGLPVYIVTGIHDGHRGSVPVGHSIRAFNALADEGDRVSDDDIAYVEANERPPEARAFSGVDPFYGAKSRVMMRATSANARLTIFDGGHGGNTAAGLDFLSRQRRGRPADFTLPATASSASQKVEAITK